MIDRIVDISVKILELFTPKERDILEWELQKVRELQRYLEKQERREQEEADYLHDVEQSIKRAYDSLEKAIASSTCSICRELLMEMKKLPLEREVVAISELKTYMRLAEQGDVKAMESYLDQTKELKSLFEKLVT